MKSLFLAVPSSLLLLFSQATQAAPADITIQSITASGDACPEGTVTITPAPDNRSFSVLFDQALAQSNESAPLETKICELTIVSQVPAGWKFNLHTSDYRGFAFTDKGSSAFQRTSYFRLSPKNEWILFKRTKKNFTSAFNDNYTIHHESNIRQNVNSRCTDHLETIKIQLQLSAKSTTKKISAAQIALDSFDGTVQGTKEICLNN